MIFELTWIGITLPFGMANTSISNSLPLYILAALTEGESLTNSFALCRSKSRSVVRSLCKCDFNVLTSAAGIFRALECFNSNLA